MSGDNPSTRVVDLSGERLGCYIIPKVNTWRGDGQDGTSNAKGIHHVQRSLNAPRGKGRHAIRVRMPGGYRSLAIDVGYEVSVNIDCLLR